jgi:hypothetical protein
VAPAPSPAPAVPDAPPRPPPLPAEPPFPPIAADPPAPPPPIGCVVGGAPALPPWPVAEPPTPPPLRAEPQPIEDINKTRPAPANNLDGVFNDFLAMSSPFIHRSSVPSQCFLWHRMCFLDCLSE